MRVLIPLALAALLSACADAPKTGAMLTYETKPEGAKIYQGTTLLGTAPVRRTYPTDGKPSVDTPEVTAVWASGAKTTFWTRLNAGDDQLATLERPANAPNLDVDLAAAAPYAKKNKADADRDKDQTLRDQKAYSQACLDARAKGNLTAAANACN
ncbi:MAG: hypothetical protein JO006_18860 [Paucibacter sp.]|nr:hypothetical protein [Roseateles sp.]